MTSLIASLHTWQFVFTHVFLGNFNMSEAAPYAIEKTVGNYFLTPLVMFIVIFKHVLS